VVGEHKTAAGRVEQEFRIKNDGQLVPTNWSQGTGSGRVGCACSADQTKDPSIRGNTDEQTGTNESSWNRSGGVTSHRCAGVLPQFAWHVVGVHSNAGVRVPDSNDGDVQRSGFKLAAS